MHRNPTPNDDSEDGIGSKTLVIAIAENRAREICISRLSLADTTEIHIDIVVDSYSYIETLSTIKDIAPNEILLHDGSRGSTLSRKIEELCRGESFRLLFISRQYFDQDRGAEMLGKILVGKIDSNLIAKYTVLAATYCLLRYVENCTGQAYANKSTRLIYADGTGGSDRMSIDRRTAISLELIVNATTGKQKESLFGTINFTKTKVGSRLLRANILRPLTDISTLDLRLDVVTIFINNAAAMAAVAEILKSFPEFEKTLSGLSMIPKTRNTRTARRAIDTLIYIKDILRIAQDLHRTLSESGGTGGLARHQNELLMHLGAAMQLPELEAIREVVALVLTDQTSSSKSAHEMRHQECFAVRPGVCGTLDIARKSYLQAVEEIYEAAERYSESCEFQVKVAFNSTRGYHLTTPLMNPLPVMFIQPVAQKRHISCTTEEVISLSDRAAEAIANALEITHELLLDTMEQVRDKIEALFILTDSVALLDMLLSFAELVVGSAHQWVRPTLTYNPQPNHNDVIAVKAGQHPIMASRQAKAVQKEAFVPNDCFISNLENMHIVTGANGSGKTVYIKQIGLICICAQIGCFVPAKKASIAVRDRLLSRLGASDDMEHNLSTFSTEMKEVAYILSNTTERSLIIIDELGRGTSNIDGISLAFAIAEQLQSRRGAFTLFVTHYMQLTSLAELYANVRNLHLKTTISLPTVLPQAAAAAAGGSDVASAGLKFLHHVGSGPCDIQSGYGILLAEICGFPTPLVVEARRILKIVREQYPVLVDQNPVDTTGRALSALLQQILLLRSSSLDNAGMRRYLGGLQAQISEPEAYAMLQFLVDLEKAPTTTAATASATETVVIRPI